MKKLILLPIALCLCACGTTAPIAFFGVASTGAAINVENSGEPVKDFADAKDRIVQGLVEAYSRDEFVGYETNN